MEVDICGQNLAIVFMRSSEHGKTLEKHSLGGHGDVLASNFFYEITDELLIVRIGVRRHVFGLLELLVDLRRVEMPAAHIIGLFEDSDRVWRGNGRAIERSEADG